MTSSLGYSFVRLDPNGNIRANALFFFFKFTKMGNKIYEILRLHCLICVALSVQNTDWSKFNGTGLAG